jgi:hypothetical protein
MRGFQGFLRVSLVLVAFMLVGKASAQWTYPGELSDHLQQTHGVSTSGLSHSQMLNLHDSIHEVYLVSGSTYSQSRFATSNRFHLPGRPVERAANLLSAVRPVQRATATVGAVVKAKPVRSTLKFLFF